MWIGQTGGRREKNQGEHAHQDQKTYNLDLGSSLSPVWKYLIRHNRRSRQHRHLIGHP